MNAMQHKWKQRKRPPRLERRVEFDDYEQTRDFLDALGELCEAEGYFPDTSFGRTYVNMTIHAKQDATDIDSERLALAARIDELLEAGPTHEPV